MSLESEFTLLSLSLYAEHCNPSVPLWQAYASPSIELVLEQVVASLLGEDAGCRAAYLLRWLLKEGQMLLQFV